MPGKRECRRQPGTRYGSRKDAEAAELDRKINSGANGQRVRYNYVIKACRCNGFHLMTAGQEESRAQQERRERGQTGRRKR